MDGKIQYELTLEAQKALASVRLLETQAVRTGARVGDVMQRALDRSDAAALAAETAKVGSNMSSAGNSAENLAKQIKEGHSKMRSMAVLAGGMALDVSGAALRSAGYTKEAAMLQTAGQSALQMALTGAMVGGKKLGVIGAIGGLITGGVKGYFEQDIAKSEEARKKAEEWTRALSESNVAAAALMRQIGEIDTSDALYTALTQIEDKIADIQKKSKAGLMDSGIARAQTEMLTNAARVASGRLPALVRSEQAAEIGEKYNERLKKEKEDLDAAAAKRESALRAADQARFGVDEARARADMETAVDNAQGVSGKSAVIEARNRMLEERIKGFEAFLANADKNKADPEAIAQAASGYSESWGELINNRKTLAQLGRSLQPTGPTASTLDSLGASGGYMHGSAALRDSSISAATTDLSRQTARNTGEMVVLLRQMAGNKGALWVRR